MPMADTTQIRFCFARKRGDEKVQKVPKGTVRLQSRTVVNEPHRQKKDDERDCLILQE
jgi:hypothetical protein